MLSLSLFRRGFVAALFIAAAAWPAAAQDIINVTPGSAGLLWDAPNEVGNAAEVTFSGGTFTLGDSFTLTSASGIELIVNVTDTVESITFGIGRNTELAMFDFSNKFFGDDSGMTVAPEAALSATSGRRITGYAGDYLVVTGLEAADAAAVAGALDFNRAPYFSGETYVDNSNNVRARVRFESPFDNAGVNAAAAAGALHTVLTAWDAPVITEAEYQAILANPRSAHPEAFAEQAGVFLNGVDSVTRTARDLGLRAPHRARLRADSMLTASAEPAPREFYTDYGGTVAAALADEYGDGAAENGAQEAATAASVYAYPSIVGCEDPAAQGWRMWGGYVGDRSDVNGHNGYNGYETSRHGFVLGLNRDFGTVGSIGAYAGYTWGTTTSKLASSEVTSDNGYMGVQARLSPFEEMRALSFYADLGYNWADNDMTRTLGGWSADGTFAQSGLSYGMGVEHMIAFEGFTVAPYLDLRHVAVEQEDMNERGGSVTAAGADGFSGSSLNTRLGAEIAREFLLADGSVVMPALNIAWRHEFGDENFSTSARYVRGGGSGDFALSSAPIRKDSLDIGLSVRTAKQLSANRTLGMSAGYAVNLARHDSTHTLFLGGEIGF